jgi:hypothetical protein
METGFSRALDDRKTSLRRSAIAITSIPSH